MQRFAYLKVVCLLIVEVVVVVCESGPSDQGGDLWTGKEFERGPEKGAFDSHLHPKCHGQQLLAFSALPRLRRGNQKDLGEIPRSISIFCFEPNDS